jgi:SAM-dependent methyltransferase
MNRRTFAMTNDANLPAEIPCAVMAPAHANTPNSGAMVQDQTAELPARASARREDCVQGANLDIVVRLRARKLARIRWRERLPPGRGDGEAPNFLSAEPIAAFGIPATVPVSDNQYGAPVLQMIRANRDKLFLDVGAGLRRTYHANVVNADIYPSVSTDVICVGEALPFADDQFDVVLSFSVMEHTKRPWDVAREMCRVLKPGGTIMVDWPFLQPVHGYPDHYFNATPAGNRSLFEASCDVTSLDIGWNHHPAIAIQWMLTAWRDGLPAEVAQKLEAMTVGTLIRDHIDAQLERDYCVSLHPDIKKAIAAGSILTAVKRPKDERKSGFGPPIEPLRALARRMRGALAKTDLSPRPPGAPAE